MAAVANAEKDFPPHCEHFTIGCWVAEITTFVGQRTPSVSEAMERRAQSRGVELPGNLLIQRTACCCCACFPVSAEIESVSPGPDSLMLEVAWFDLSCCDWSVPLAIADVSAFPERPPFAVIANVVDIIHVSPLVSEAQESPRQRAVSKRRWFFIECGFDVFCECCSEPPAWGEAPEVSWFRDGGFLAADVASAVVECCCFACLWAFAVLSPAV